MEPAVTTVVSRPLSPVQAGLPFSPNDRSPHPSTPLADRLAVLRDWDLSGPKAFVREDLGLAPAYLDRLEVEYKRFVELKLRFPDLDFPVSTPVDPLWHAHMLHTRDYISFSMAVRGNYLHHVPAMDAAAKARLFPTYMARTITKYREVFGEPDPMFWPTDGTICVASCIED